MNDGTTDFRNKPAIKNKTGTWKACPYTLGNECCESLAYYGINTNLVNYLKFQLNQRNVAAVSNVMNWSGTCYVMLLIGAFLADAYLGRYWTIASFSMIYVFPLVLEGLSRVSSFGADQFDNSDETEKKKKRWAWGFGIPAVAMAIAVASFFSDEESTVRGSRKLDHTKQLSFFDKAAVVSPYDQIKGSINPWSLCTVTQVEELKSIIRLLPIWATGIIFSTVYSQMGTLLVLQGNTMDLHMGGSFEIPSASLSLFDMISVIFWVPVYDCLIIPLARKFIGHKNGFTQLQRITIGLLILILTMVSAGTLDLIRFREVPQYFIIGCAEVYTFIGQLELFYEEAPDAMRSLCSALSLSTAALGNYLSTFLVNIVADLSTRDGNPGWIPDNLNYGHLHYFFWLLAALSLLNMGVYLMVARWYSYKKTVA
ncbi:Protein NRT1/ PTR FAMILY 8.1 [Hibiscus syriacus]|uniref:Protein NRT1/ PTR FAMILY 8.1 n=1 Tax=Hibiscus syriacus TaxID=106335 RepID=A0A6A3AIW4_HIBSY|nr:Protein NRT1/ PTR FAMILY 8.1 [Hibiscus syriacus]